MELGGLAGRFERRPNLLDLVRRNAGVGFAVEAEHGLLHLWRKIDGTLRRGVAVRRELATPTDARRCDFRDHPDNPPDGRTDGETAAIW